MKREAHRPASVFGSRSTAPKRAHSASRFRTPSPRRFPLSWTVTRWSIHRDALSASRGLSVLETKSILSRCVFLLAVLLHDARWSPYSALMYRRRDVPGDPTSFKGSAHLGGPPPSLPERGQRAPSFEVRRAAIEALQTTPQPARIVGPQYRRPTVPKPIIPSFRRVSGPRRIAHQPTAEAITLPSPTASGRHRRPTIPQNYGPTPGARESSFRGPTILRFRGSRGP